MVLVFRVSQAKSISSSAMSCARAASSFPVTSTVGPTCFLSAQSLQGLGAVEVAELCHRDAAQRQRRRVLARRDPVQGTPSGSAAASARRAVIRECIGIPTHL